MGAIPHFELGRFESVAIGSSMGGSALLDQIICRLPADLPLPVFVAQHLPPQFTLAFARQLDDRASMHVVHAEHGMEARPGVVYIAPGMKHMRVRMALNGRRMIEVSDQPAGLFFKPSIDELLISCAAVYGPATLAIVMTGSGHDGTVGARTVRQAGGYVLTQTLASCDTEGMPRSCVEAGLSDARLDPDDIRKAITQLSPALADKAMV